MSFGVYSPFSSSNVITQSYGGYTRVTENRGALAYSYNVYTGATASPTVAPSAVSTITGIDPGELAAATYGKIIPIFRGGLARIGGNIIVGPYFNTIGSDLCATFGISFGFPANPEGSRQLREIALDSIVVWTLAQGFLGSSFTFRFAEGTYTQAADTIETSRYGSNSVAYRPQMVLYFENLPLTPYGNKIPFVAALIGDDTDGADPLDGIDLGTALNDIAYSPWVGMTAASFETTGIDDLVDAVIFAEDKSFVQVLREFARVYATWDVLQTDKLRVVDRGSDVTPDIVLTRSEIVNGPVTFDRQEPTSVARELELITIDPGADYVMLPATAKRPREPLAVSGSAGKEVITLPAVIDAETRQSLVTLLKYHDEHTRRRARCSAMVFGYEIEPGDLVALSDVADGISDEVFKCIDTLHGANYTVELTLEAIINCQVSPPVSAFLGHYEEDTAAATHTFTGCDLGTPSEDRLIVVVVGGGTNDRTISSITLGGTPMDIHLQTVDPGTDTFNDVTMAVASLLVPSGTSATIVVTYSGAVASSFLAVYGLTSLTSLTPHDTASGTSSGDNPSTTINVPANGVLIAGYYGSTVLLTDGAENLGPVTWTNVFIEDFDELVDNQLFFAWGSCAHQSNMFAQSSRPISVAAAALGRESIIAASFG